MKKKSILFISICLTILSSCTSYRTTIDSFDDVSFQNDLNNALLLDVTEYNEDIPFTLNSFVTSSQTGNIYTIQISYKDITLNTFNAIMFPNIDSLDTTKTYPSIGYTGQFELSNEKNVKEDSYPGFNLSYKSKENDEYKLFVSFDDEEYVFIFTTFKSLGE